MELLKFLPSTKEGLEDLVNGEEDESEPKKDVGVERDEGADCMITIFVPTIVTAVISNPIEIVFVIFGNIIPIVKVCVILGNIDIGIGLSTLIIL